MGFVRTPDQVAKIQDRLAENRFNDIRRVSVEYFTEPSIVERVLPPGLSPTDDPRVYADVFTVGGSNCVGAFDGGGLYVEADYDGTVGNYCLTMPMSTDVALIWGRELFGEPKKGATARLDREGDEIDAAVRRRGETIIDIDARMETTEPPDPESRAVFHYKCQPDVSGRGFQYDPILLQVTFRKETQEFERGSGSLSLASTPHDPLGDLEVREILDVSYSVGSLVASPEPLTTIDPEAFRPYAYGNGRVDDWLALDTEADTTSESPPDSSRPV